MLSIFQQKWVSYIPPPVCIKLAAAVIVAHLQRVTVLSGDTLIHGSYCYLRVRLHCPFCLGRDGNLDSCRWLSEQPSSSARQSLQLIISFALPGTVHVMKLLWCELQHIPKGQYLLLKKAIVIVWALIVCIYASLHLLQRFGNMQTLLKNRLGCAGSQMWFTLFTPSLFVFIISANQ